MERGVDVSNDPPIFIVSGAHDTGKSSALRSLNEVFGYPILAAASDRVLSTLGNRSFHPSDKPFVLNNTDIHICPRCKPTEFTQLVLEKQLEIEKDAGREKRVILERGYCDYLAYLRWVGINEFSDLNFNQANFARYHLVFLLEVMEELQEPKFGFSKEERIERALRLNELMLREYVDAGYRVVIIPPGTIRTRASIINEIIRDTKTKPPPFYIVNYQRDYNELMSEVNDFLKKRGLYSPSLLYRLTGEKHLEKVLMCGTDRAGLDNEMCWEEQGYTGPPRIFEDVIYASTEKEILEGIEIESLLTSFKKIPITANPYLLVYDASKLELVHRDHQYAFRDASKKKEALLAILKIKAARQPRPLFHFHIEFPLI